METVLHRLGEIAWLPLPAGWPAGVTGGVSTRLGGVSPPPLDSLNLGTRVGDDPANVAANLGRLAQAAKAPLAAAARIPLRHGSIVQCVDHGGLNDPGDALVTRVPGLPLALTVADCRPVLFAAGDRAVALAHAGWRGTLAGVAPAAVRALSIAAGLPPKALHAWIGPGIGPCCYDLPEADARGFPHRFRRPAGGGRIGRESVDLAGLLEDQLLAAGVAPERLSVTASCSACQPELFYSHRRNGGRTGRMLAWIMLSPLIQPRASL